MSAWLSRLATVMPLDILQNGGVAYLQEEETLIDGCPLMPPLQRCQKWHDRFGRRSSWKFRRKTGYAPGAARCFKVRRDCRARPCCIRGSSFFSLPGKFPSSNKSLVNSAIHVFDRTAAMPAWTNRKSPFRVFQRTIAARLQQHAGWTGSDR